MAPPKYPTEAQVLKRINTWDRKPRPTTEELAESFGVAVHTVNRRLNALAADGLVGAGFRNYLFPGGEYGWVLTDLGRQTVIQASG